MSLSIKGLGMTSQRTRDRLINILRENNIKNEDVLSVMASTPRHLFVDEALSTRAYENISLPIGHGQTISQPYMVARMTQAAGLQGHERVLEIGTGSGYQAAILSRICERIYTIERIDS
ncbi:MAG: protein-L-isoaspartate O-methyltransferase, partial [Gammaproteobacteria bacterium]|nr:protein-L-isoaspartate O-methyltransferase [Gammaproteobacteria bacterium]